MPNDRPLAIQFSDLREFTAITEERGDEEAYRLVRQFIDLVQNQVSGHGGLVLKTYGDGVMTSFEDAEEAVECSIEMQDALCAEYCHGDETDLSAGIGLTWGTAIRTDGDLFGSSVNLAKRIADVAKGGQIVVSSTVAEHSALSTSGRRFRDLGARPLKGLGEHRLYEVVWRDEVAALRTYSDDMELILTDDDRLVIQFAKEALDELQDVQEKLAGLGEGEGGLSGRLKRAIGRRVARKLPDMVEWISARAGMGIEHELGDVEARREEGETVLYINGRKRISLGDRNVSPAEAERFIRFLEARKRGAHPSD
jgi:class 3 adenylate cyclase